MKQLEVVFEKISSAGLVLYLAGIFGLVLSVAAVGIFGLVLSVAAVIVKVTTLNEILIYGAYFFGFGFALMMLGMLGLAFLSKVANKHTIKKHR